VGAYGSAAAAAAAAASIWFTVMADPRIAAAPVLAISSPPIFSARGVESRSSCGRGEKEKSEISGTRGAAPIYSRMPTEVSSSLGHGLGRPGPRVSDVGA
jgi:hypothetical protein